MLASTVTLAAPADTYVRNGTYSGQNYGQAGTMELKNVGIARLRPAGVCTASTSPESACRGDHLGQGPPIYGKLLNTAVASMPVGTLLGGEHHVVREHDLTWSNRARRRAPRRSVTKTITGTTGAWYE